MCTSPQGRVSSAHHKWLAGTLCRDPPRQSNGNLWKCVEVHVLQHISSASSRSEVTCANCCWSTCKYKAHENAGASCGYLFADCFWIRTTLLLWAQLSVFFLRPKTGVLQLFFLKFFGLYRGCVFPSNIFSTDILAEAAASCWNSIRFSSLTAKKTSEGCRSRWSNWAADVSDCLIFSFTWASLFLSFGRW